jgi:hypothetical protein
LKEERRKEKKKSEIKKYLGEIIEE